MSKSGIVIANTGSPAEATPEAVRTYLQEFLTDPRICPMPAVLWNVILNAFILPRRSVTSAAKYERIWEPGGSPLAVRMASLAQKLDAASGDATSVRYAMSYGSPSMKDALRELREDGCTELAVISLYPQSAFSTAGVVQDKLQVALDALDWHPPLRFVERYAERDEYLDAIVASIVNAGFTEDDKLLMTFHSIPMRDIRNGDTYDEQACATAEAVAERLGLAADQWALGYQSRFDKSRAWLGPTTGEALDALGSTERLFVVAPNFSIDCLESIYDIDRVLRERVLDAQLAHSFHYIPCLNDTDAHVRLLQTIIEKVAPLST